MTDQPETIAERLQNAFDSLTRAERQLADSLLQNYPVSGLASITQVAKAAEVSTPTVVRMVQKLGFSGFPDFQNALRRELEAQISDPITKHDTWVESAPDAHILNRFTDAVMGNIRQTLTQIDPEQFDRACAMLAETNHSVLVVGGRITRALADYFFMHMQVARPGVTHIQSMSNAWVHYLLDIKPGDVVVIFDVRRYENSTLRLAKMAKEKGARIVLFTDQWRSPVHEFADCTFCGRIAVPSAWDSNTALMLILEAMIAEVQEHTWDLTRQRMEELEGMFDRTRFFRKFT
ncbi:MAG: MurR/RpiR family transcriptional regulator [Pseudomonadota bacterium]|uniref:Als operon repressor n=1 Tax=Thalassovita autumnalis TaxID=2072972 RepID=A0A0P1FF35_9RHOB|nr:MULTISPECIES: MurR/RpiR family transcriptional regulator [Thalassovita]MEC8039419.1 MurR/RpiR family transcriptional regulator [Pseudomonadota bacterium]MEC8292894.1 MurR/RpiR family transcriptional regulator [Pseudomonadota bacterium]CUH66612.1 Als operon repressor [Thalassovita autumnalis]CUH71289.1 Als operon repressor [Thalassovita autumnalis]